jgi:hypothetical protein
LLNGVKVLILKAFMIHLFEVWRNMGAMEKIEQKGMTFDYNFGYPLPIFSSLFLADM